MNNSLLACTFTLAGLGLIAWPGARADVETFMDLRNIAAVQGDAAAGKANSATCAACHVQDGISVVPLFPNLAGQHAEYMYWRMREIQQEARADSPMTALLANLDDTQLRNFSAWYASLPPAQHAEPARGQLRMHPKAPASGAKAMPRAAFRLARVATDARPRDIRWPQKSFAGAWFPSSDPGS